jgi:hypothetical protein
MVLSNCKIEEEIRAIELLSADQESREEIKVLHVGREIREEVET